MAEHREWEYSEVQPDPSREREFGGKLVRDAWVGWAHTQEDAKPSWLVPWEELPERDQEADRCIYDALKRHFERISDASTRNSNSDNSSRGDSAISRDDEPHSSE